MRLTLHLSHFEPTSVMPFKLPLRPAAAAAKHLRLQSTAAPSTTQLNWPEYLKLRKSVRRAGLLASIPTTALGFSLSASQFGNIEADPTAVRIAL
jgi:hypothetical protein